MSVCPPPLLSARFQFLFGFDYCFRVTAGCGPVRTFFRLLRAGAVGRGKGGEERRIPRECEVGQRWRARSFPSCVCSARSVCSGSEEQVW